MSPASSCPSTCTRPNRACSTRCCKRGLKDKPKVEPTPIVLLDAASQSYKAQTGLVGTRGEQLPTHNTLMTVTTPERKLADAPTSCWCAWSRPKSAV